MATRYKSIRYDRAVELEKELSEKVAELLQKAEQEAKEHRRTGLWNHQTGLGLPAVFASGSE